MQDDYLDQRRKCVSDEGDSLLMTTTRRGFVKILGLGSLMSLCNFSDAWESCPTPPNGYLNVLLHGLFFMQLDNSDPHQCKLEIFAPEASSHDVFVGTFESVTKLTADIDWSDPRLGLLGKNPDGDGVIPKDVPPSVLQFSRTDTGVGALIGKYRRKITLPWPCEMVSLRFGSINRYFQPDPSTAVGKNVLYYCRDQNPDKNKNIGSVTCLRYGFAFPPLPGNPLTANFQLYHQYCSLLGEGMQHVKSSLIDSQSLFDPQAKQKFDLQPLASDSDPITPGDAEHDTAVLGISPQRDEISLNEDQDYLNWFGDCSDKNSTIAKAFSKAKKKKQARIIKQRGKHRASFETLYNYNPSNCPSFFVGT